MKKIIISSLLSAFILFFIGICLIIISAININLIMMYIGLIILIISLIFYLILIIIGVRFWYLNKFKGE